MVLGEVRNKYLKANSPGFCIKGEGIRDRSNVENVSIIIRFVNNSVPEEHLIGQINFASA